MNFSRNFYTFLICLSLVLVFGLSPKAFSQSSPLKIEHVITDNFPEIKLLVSGEGNLLPEEILIQDNDASVEVLGINEELKTIPLKVAIVFGHSESMMAGVASGELLSISGKEVNEISDDEFDDTPRLLYAKESIIGFLRSMNFDKDSVILVNYSDGINNTDLNNNLDVLEMILASQEAAGGRVFYDALQYGLEAMLPHEGYRVMIALVDGPDTHSTTPYETILGTAKLMNMPIHIIGFGNAESEILSELALSSGGSYSFVSDLNDLENQLLTTSREVQSLREIHIRLLDTIASNSQKHELTLSFANQSEREPISAVYEWGNASQENIDTDSKTLPFPRWIGMALALIFCILLVVVFLRWRRAKASEGLIVPAITEIRLDMKRGVAKIYMNIPMRNKPARVTLYTDGGKPVKDLVFKGTKRRAKLTISDLPDGIYHCELSNSGMTSERAEMVITT